MIFERGNIISHSFNSFNIYMSESIIANHTKMFTITAKHSIAILYALSNGLVWT